AGGLRVDTDHAWGAGRAVGQLQRAGPAVAGGGRAALPHAAACATRPARGGTARGVGDRGAAGTRAAACDRRRPSRGGGVVAGTRGTGGTSASAPGRRGAGGTSATVEMDRVRRPGAALATGPKPCAGEPAGLAAVGRDRDRVA